jgi:hypothetical protein
MKAWDLPLESPNLVLAVTAHPLCVEPQQQDIRTFQPVVQGMAPPTIATLVLGERAVDLREGTVPKQQADLQGHIKKVCKNSRPTTSCWSARILEEGSF